MARKKLPKLFLHRGTGYWCIETGGRRRYLSKDHAEAIQKYAAACEDLQAARISETPTVRTVGDVVAEYLEWASTVKYVKRGKPTAQVDRIRGACRVLCKLYETTAIARFDEFALEAVQGRMVADGLARGEINARIGCLKRMFRWAAARRMVAGAVVGQLLLVEGLRKGSGRGVERRPVEPVADEVVNAALPYLSPAIVAMVKLQGLTGMRPGEVCHLRPCDLDTSGDVWLYRVPAEWNKLAHFGIARTVKVGPAGQAILKPFLAVRAQADYCFVPTPRRTSPCYNRRTYAKAIWRAIMRAQRKWHPPLVYPLHWHPNQLRHAAGTRIRAHSGLDAAQDVLGHSSREMTERYAKLDESIGWEAIRKIG